MPLGSSELGAARASSSRRRWKGPFLVHASGAANPPAAQRRAKLQDKLRRAQEEAAAGAAVACLRADPRKVLAGRRRDHQDHTLAGWVQAPDLRRHFLHRLAAEVAPLLEPGETVGRQPPACPIRLPRHSRRRRAKEVFQDGHRRPHTVEEGEHDVPAGSARLLKGRLQHHRRLGRAPVGYPTRGRSPRRGPVLSLAPLLLRAVAVLRLGLAFPAAVLPRLGPITIPPSPVLGPVLPAG